MKNNRITEIKIQNFQAHESLDINLDPSITTIVGRSDRGKSAVIRALRFACLNKPRGSSFVKKGKKGTLVTIVAGGQVIKRKRTKSKNTYKLNTEEYKAFGTGIVPDPIKTILKVSDTNFQSQHDPPFLLADTPGQISKRINQIINLGGVDQALAFIGQHVRKAKSEKDFTEERLKEAEQSQEELRWTVEFNQDMESFLSVKKRHEEKSNRIVLLRELLQTAIKCKRRSDLASKAIVDVSKLGLKAKKLLKKQEQQTRLKKLIKSAREMKQVTDQPVPDVSKLLSTRADADIVAEKYRILEGLIKKAVNAKEKLCRIQQHLQTCKKNMPNVCPTCKRPIQSSSSAPTCTSH